MPVWLVTGGSGFLGRQVLSALTESCSKGDRIFAIGRRLPHDWPASSFVPVDLFEREKLASIIADVAPTHAIHAAGKTPPGEASEFYHTNVLGSLNLIDALAALGTVAKLVVVGSAAEYGLVPVGELPIREDRRCEPAESYALSKYLATTAALVACRPLEVVVARMFNLAGPGMPPSLAFGRFARELATSSPDPLTLRVGDLSARRDFIDVRDAALALILLALRGLNRSIYNVATGTSRPVGDGLSALISLSGRAVRVMPNAGPGLGTGVIDSRADVRRIVSEIGWSPSIPFEQSLADLWVGVASLSRPPEGSGGLLAPPPWVPPR